MNDSKYQVLQERFEVEKILKERILGSIFTAFHENLATYLQCDPAAINISIGDEEVRGSSIVIPLDATLVVTSADASKKNDVELCRVEVIASVDNDKVIYKFPNSESQYGMTRGKYPQSFFDAIFEKARSKFV